MPHILCHITLTCLLSVYCSSSAIGQCPDGEIEDCNGNCAPPEWVGDGTCDDGTYLWNGIPIYFNCDEFNCDGGDCSCGGDPTGACCFFDEYCFEVPLEMCMMKDGEFYPDLTCDEITCGTVDPVGACCLLSNCLLITESDCTSYDGEYHGDGTDCTDVTCESKTGGCCWGPFCLEATQVECESWVDSIWLGVGPTCQVDACSDQPGACCVAGTCLLSYEEDCLSMDGVYHGNGIPCEVIECHPNYVTGACCLGDGACEQVSNEECDDLDGEFVGTDLACDEVECYSCPADIDGSGETNVDDLLMLVSHWGTSDPQSDINHDGTVDIDDLLQLMSEWGPCLPGKYTGGGDDLEGIFSLVDLPGLSVPLTIWMECRIPIPQPSTDPVPIELAELQLTGNSPVFGELSLVCPSPASGTVDLQGGILQANGIIDFTCDLLDSLLPPERPFAGADYLDGESQSYAFSLTAAVEPDGDQLLRIVDGSLDLTSASPPGKLPVELATVHIPIQNISMRRKQYTNMECRTHRRCNKKILCMQPVLIRYTKDGEEAVTGLSLEDMKGKADEIWSRICIEFEWRPAVTIDLLKWNGKLPVRSDNYVTNQVKSLLEKRKDPDCIEIFFVDRFAPRKAWAFATRLGKSTSQIVINDSKCVADDRDTVLAHEIGHSIGLKHAPSGSGNLMEKAGRDNDDIKILWSQIKRIRNSLLKTKTPKTECCLDPS